MRNEAIVAKLIAYTDKVLAYCEGYNYDSFSADKRSVEACVFNISQMGELVRRLDDEFTEAHPEIPWHALYGLRNRIVHDYEGVNLQLVWEIISDDLPVLKSRLERL